MRKLTCASTLILLLSGFLLAQGRRGNGPAAGAGLNLSQSVTIEGAITALNLAYGVQYPSLVVNNTEIKLAPVWYFIENDFELAVNDRVRVVAAPCLACSDPTLAAIQVTNLAANAVIQLRSATTGLPLWTTASRQAMARPTPGLCNSASLRVVTGAITNVTAGAGIQTPTLTLAVGSESLVIRIGPERVLLAADFPLMAGDTITARIVLASDTGQYLALSLTNTAGDTLVLRQDDCTPAWNR